MAPPAPSLLRRLVKTALPHRREHYQRLLFRRLDERQLRRALEHLGVQPGMTVFVHASLSQLGYLSGGPRSVIRALAAAVGPAGTVAMPSFPFSGSMQDYVATRPEFDLRGTPSRVGALTEEFRT